MPRVDVRFDSFPLKGGLDLHTPQLSLPPGVARDALNWECSINGGYSRIPGYERFDGRTSPTAATYSTLVVSSTSGLAVGDAINGQTSGATGTVCYIDGTTLGYTKASGTFQAAENLREGATVIGTVTTVGASITDQTVLATIQLAASDIYRADITAVPGSGDVLGVVAHEGVVYALRNNAGGTAAEMYKSSGTGWTAVPFKYELAFTAGSGTQPAEGATITQGAVSATLRRVALESGSFSGGDAAGRLIIEAPTGGNFSAGAFTAGITATCSGAQTVITLLPGGRFEFDIGNAGNGVRIYGCDGVNRGFEFDGTYLVPVETGMTTDTPTHVRVHKRHLFFAFETSAQHAAPGTPYVWSPVLGAAEIGANEDITGFLVLPGDNTTAALAIMTANTTSILYGTGVSTWQLVDVNAAVGSKAYAAQTLGQSYLFDDSGVIGVQAVQSFGNFTTTTLTQNLRQFVQSRRTLVTASLVNREKSQYRVFFSDGYGLFATIVNNRFLGAMPVLFPDPATCTASGESSNGTEVSYFGSTNGFVYRLDTGTSFDGDVITHNIDLAFASQGNDRVRKRYRKAVFEVQGEGYSEFSAGYTLAYGNEDVANTVTATETDPAYWDEFTWDEFVWDGRSIAPSQLALEGSAENISLRIEGSSALWSTFTINSITLHYTPRRIIR